MYSNWTKGLSEQEEKDFKSQVSGGKVLLERIKSALEDHMEASIVRQESEQGYALASWPYFQADSIGQQRAYGKAVDLIENLIKG